MTDLPTPDELAALVRLDPESVDDIERDVTVWQATARLLDLCLHDTMYAVLGELQHPSSDLEADHLLSMLTAGICTVAQALEVASIRANLAEHSDEGRYCLTGAVAHVVMLLDWLFRHSNLDFDEARLHAWRNGYGTHPDDDDDRPF